MAIGDYVEVFTDEDRDLTFIVKDKNADGGFLDITGATEIVVSFPQELSSDALEKKLTESDVSIVSGPGGKFTVSLDTTDTALLKYGERQDVTALITLSSGAKRRVRFHDVLTVPAPLFS